MMNVAKDADLMEFYQMVAETKGPEIADEALKLATRKRKPLDFGDALIQAEARVDKRTGALKEAFRKIMEPFSSDWMGRD